MKKQNIIILAILVMAVAVAGYAYQRQQQKAADIADDTTIRTLVGQFGASMQKVSLSAPDAPAEIADVYAPYASSSVIKEWQQNRSFAPGRGLSSPWPSGITIAAVTKKGNDYQVQGMVTEVTHATSQGGVPPTAVSGIAAEYPVTLMLSKYKSQWLITGYSAGVETTFAPKMPATSVQQ